MSEAAAINRSVQRVSAAPFTITAFVGASLIFLVQPMFARMATPLLGGAPAVWNVSLVCFQAALLLGYAYAHLLSRLSSLRTQVFVHATVLVLGFLCLPLRLSNLMGEPPADAPTLWLVGTFAVSIAPPFAALAATAPLIQHWYARSGLADAADPYHLYAASNIGSLAGLAAYPLLIEPFTAIADQSSGWMVGYALLAAVLLYSGWSIARAGKGATPIATETSAAAAEPTWREKLVWLALSFVPSSLLVGATSHITTDVAAAPFLWAPPLMIYLITFVIAFSKKPAISNKAALIMAPIAAAGAAATLLVGGRNVMLGMTTDLTALFTIALACHGLLNARRPGAKHLTQFYLIMSLGGVLGGAFNALLAPVIFNTVLEYPLMLIAGVALLGISNPKVSRFTMMLLGLAAVMAVVAMIIGASRGTPSFLMLFGMLAPAAAAVIVSRRAPLGAAAALALATPIGITFDQMRTDWSGRSFFGVIKIVDVPLDDEPGAKMRFMMHGTTLHGMQRLSGDRLAPQTYYSPVTPIGQSFTLYGGEAKKIGIVGLGIGSTACFAKPDQSWRFYEIDPLVVDVATDPSRFTFMSSCAPKADIVLGDARIKLASEPKARFDFLLLDAFSSDSVPTHLLTAEAMQLYLDKLTEDGVLIVHISNRHLALRPVVGRLVATTDAKALWQLFKPTKAQIGSGVSGSEVVLVSRSEEKLARARATGKWFDLASDGGRPWTDDYSNIIGAMLERANAKKEPATAD